TGSVASTDVCRVSIGRQRLTRSTTTDRRLGSPSAAVGFVAAGGAAPHPVHPVGFRAAAVAHRPGVGGGGRLERGLDRRDRTLRRVGTRGIGHARNYSHAVRELRTGEGSHLSAGTSMI